MSQKLADIRNNGVNDMPAADGLRTADEGQSFCRRL